MKRREPGLRLGELDDEDFYAIWLEAISLWAGSRIRWIFFREGNFDLIRMMMITILVFPLSRWMHTPTICDPHLDLFGAWMWSVMATVGLSKVLPV